MKKLTKTLLIILIAAYTISCGNNVEPDDHDHSEQDHDQEQVEPKHDHDHEEVEDEKEEHAQDESTIELDNGNLWSANIETTEGITKMVGLMDSFSDVESVEAYSILSGHLNTTLNTILKECSMEGEAHDHLHTYLFPMFNMIAGIGSTELKTCKVNFNALEKQLAEYPKYFD
jgi:hypothetical protein